MDIKIEVALISAITSIIVTLLSYFGKLIYEKYSVNYRLKKEYEYEQRKKYQNEVSKYKIRALNSGEELNKRLWNFIDNREKGWHNVTNDNYLIKGQYYYHSTIYLFLVFLYWIDKIERNTEYIDTTIISQKETNFLLLLKNMKSIFCDVELFEGFRYNSQYSTHHFFKLDLEASIKFVESDKGVIEYDEFVDKLIEDPKGTRQWCSYIANISSSAYDCPKYNVIVSFHFLLVTFLNEYGYEFQKTNKNNVEVLTNHYKQFIYKKGFNNIISKNYLSKIKTLKEIIAKYDVV